MAVASINRTSPPVPVTDRPVATPGTAVRSAASWNTFCRPSASRTASRSITTGTAPASRLRGSSPVPASPDLADTVALALARPQVVPGDGDLLGHGVAVEADDLHAVQQRAGNGLGDVGGGDEQHLRQVDLDIEVVVAERVVLRR